MSHLDDEVKLVDIAVNNDLLNPKFEGYKLALDQLPIKEFPLPSGISVLRPSDEQFSMQHAKIFASSGVLFFDPWSSSDSSSIFIFPQSDGNLYYIEYDSEAKQWGQLITVVLGAFRGNSERLPLTLTFPAPDVVVVCTGSDQIQIFTTSEGRKKWKAALNFVPFDNTATHILDSRFHNEKFEILVQAIIEHQKVGENDHAVFDHCVAWITLNPEKWEVARKQVILLGGHADLIAFDDKCDHVVIVSSKKPKILEDSEGIREVKEDEDKMDIDENEKKAYVWTEKGDEVSIAFQLDPSVKKTDIKIKPSSNSILVDLGGNVLLDGKLGGHILPEEATWTLSDNNKLEVTLFKSVSGVRWSFLVEGCQRGRYEMDPSLLDDAVSALEKFSSESKAPGASGVTENFNSEQLEECDMMDDEMSTIFWFNREKQSVVQQCDITGHQFLFETQSSGKRSQICLRCDVDGVLFEIEDGQLVHKATFNALGYIQASKSLRRWTLRSPENSYAVIAEGSNHAFIYWQPDELNTELRNRKTKEQIAAVAKQHVISLKSRETGISLETPKDYSILSAHATNDVLFLATPDTLYAVCVK